VRHLHALERFVDSRAPLRARQSPINQGQLHVFPDAQLAEQVERLEDEADLPIAEARPSAAIERANVHAVQSVSARGRLLQQAQDGEQGRLAGA
jgi:hypothetical protein